MKEALYSIHFAHKDETHSAVSYCNGCFKQQALRVLDGNVTAKGDLFLSKFCGIVLVLFLEA